MIHTFCTGGPFAEIFLEWMQNVGWKEGGQIQSVHFVATKDISRVITAILGIFRNQAQKLQQDIECIPVD